MPRVARVIAPEYPHHITQRGNNRAIVFFDDKDKTAYLSILKEYCDHCSVQVWAYCLMPNHVHLLVVPADEVSLSRCIGTTNLLYTQHINRTYKRSGRLWQNRFFSTVVETESYLWAVVRYIEKNPVKARLVQRPQDFPWSSCRANISGTYNELVASDGWLNEKERGAYEAFLMQDDPATDEQIRLSTSTGRPMGSESFIAGLENILSRKLRPGKAGRPKKTKTV